MKQLLVLLLMMVPLVSFADEDDVDRIMIKVSPNKKVMTLSGSRVENDVDYLLVETTIETGTYKVELTLLNDYVYHIEGTDYYLYMPMCLELAYMDDAILKVTEYGGFSFAKVIWED